MTRRSDPRARRSGRSLRNLSRQDTAAYLINETAPESFGWDHPVGKRLYGPDGGIWGTVVGVVAVFHTESLREAIHPIVLRNRWRRARQVLVRVDGRNVPAALEPERPSWEYGDTLEPISDLIRELRTLREEAIEEAGWR